MSLVQEGNAEYLHVMCGETSARSVVIYGQNPDIGDNQERLVCFKPFSDQISWF